VKINRRQKAFDNMFNCFVKEGRELGYMEATRLYPTEMAALKRVAPGSDLRVLFSRIRKIYANRWHEIYNKGVVQEKPEKVSRSTLSPLEALKVATGKGK
jgi:saccharopine dehydrogenase-like NADP-dependent oxidoreductase